MSWHFCIDCNEIVRGCSHSYGSESFTVSDGTQPVDWGPLPKWQDYSDTEPCGNCESLKATLREVRALLQSRAEPYTMAIELINTALGDTDSHDPER